MVTAAPGKASEIAKPVKKRKERNGGFNKNNDHLEV
jgi:hypothetical protein